MKPVERTGYLNLYILVQQNSQGQLFVMTNHSGQFGSGFFNDLSQAQQHQTMERMKGNTVEIFHIEWPI